ncbi:MAG: hypothetical protein WDO14_18850 [Bacteroidota bacterium]
MRSSLLILSAVAMFIFSCEDRFDEQVDPPVQPSTTLLSGQAVIKILPSRKGWVAIKETLQPQFSITQPIREISWMNSDFTQTSNFKPDDGWSLIDAVVHPSGQVTAVVVQLDMRGGADHVWHMKALRFKTDGSMVESELSPLPITNDPIPFFPLSYDRVKLVAFGENVYVVARWKYNYIEASRLIFINNQLTVDWQKVVEPDHYVGLIGIIGGGFDNFHQGDRYCFVYADVDSKGDLYVAAPSTEELLINHDSYFSEDLTASADPATYDYGVAVLTKFSSEGERLWAKLEGHASNTRLLGMRVGNNSVYFIGRQKTGTEANSWDAWVYAADAPAGSKLYESTIDVQDGDMFWDLQPLQDGGAIAVGSTGYTQNPSGLSVSDARKALAVVLDAQGKMTGAVELPQGPVERGSEAMFTKVLGDGSIVVSGVHNAPGTHAPVYCDGFIAVRGMEKQ